VTVAALPHAEIEEFIADGFVRLDGAFPRALADECRALLWKELGLDPTDRSTWVQPVIRLPGFDTAPFLEAANTPRLLAAFDQLVGPGRWYPRANIGTFPVRFPSNVDPGDAGWHIDGSYKVDPGPYTIGDRLHVNLWSRGRALLLLFLFSDVGPHDAPTRIRVGSHLDVPRVLAPAGEAGMPFQDVNPRLPATTHQRPIAWTTGNAGDVYLCHPFLVHAASWPHRGTAPRFIAQPPLTPVGVLNLARADGDYSPVEVAVRRGLGLT
jgi:hypothetical protein